MIKSWNPALPIWDEYDIALRESLISKCYQVIKRAWAINPAIQFHRIETPVLILEGSEKFELYHVGDGEDTLYHLRPETTAGSIWALKEMFPQKEQRKKALPICLWQVGKSFRNENSGSFGFGKMRFREFYQLEFHLFASEGTKCQYHVKALEALLNIFGGERQEVPTESLPHYSKETYDWVVETIKSTGESLRYTELAGCSLRHDWSDGMLFEVSIGLDRLVLMESDV